MIRLFRVSIPSSVVVLIVLEMAILLGCYTAASYFTATEDLQFYLFYDGGWLPIVLVTVVIQVGLYFQDLYDHLRPHSRIYLAQQISLVLGGAFLLQALLGYGRSGLQLPKWTMMYGSLMVLVVLPLWRLGFYALISKALPAEKLLFLGASAALRGIALQLGERPEMGSVVVGYLSSAPADLFRAPWLGDVDQLEEVVSRIRPDRIVVGLTESRGRLPMQQLLDLRFSGIPIEEAPTAFESVFGRVSIQDLRPSQLIFSREMGPVRWMVVLQAFYSLLFGIVGMVISLPIMAVTALLVKFSSPGPILLRQTRVGLHGTALHAVQIPLDVRRRRGAHRRSMGNQGRSSHYSHGVVAPQAPPG